jgi:hypothetical protein
MDTIRVSDECWIALALLHREQPRTKSFTPKQILERLAKEHIHPTVRPGAQVHVYQHNVANLPPVSGKYRMFYRLADTTLRLYRLGDPCHPARKGRTRPDVENIPAKYKPLIVWYEERYCKTREKQATQVDPLLAARGLGAHLWVGIDSDQYIRDLRSGWPKDEINSQVHSANLRKAV